MNMISILKIYTHSGWSIYMRCTRRHIVYALEGKCSAILPNKLLYTLQ